MKTASDLGMGGYQGVFAAPHSLKEALDRTLAALPSELDGIAIRGMSGATVGGMVAVQTDIPLIFVRKPGEATHATENGRSYHVYGPKTVARYLILDDFVETGRSIRQMHDKLTTQYPDATCAGIYLYRDGQFHANVQDMQDHWQLEGKDI